MITMNTSDKLLVLMNSQQGHASCVHNDGINVLTHNKTSNLYNHRYGQLD